QHVAVLPCLAALEGPQLRAFTGHRLACTRSPRQWRLVGAYFLKRDFDTEVANRRHVALPPHPAVHPGRPERRVCGRFRPLGCPSVNGSDRPSAAARLDRPRRRPMPLSGHSAAAVPLVWPARWATLLGRLVYIAAPHTSRAVGARR